MRRLPTPMKALFFTHFHLENFCTYATEDLICRILLIVLRKISSRKGTYFCSRELIFVAQHNLENSVSPLLFSSKGGFVLSEP
jgi:hypothetical protein